jgi:hypothetical protein
MGSKVDAVNKIKKWLTSVLELPFHQMQAAWSYMYILRSRDAQQAGRDPDVAITWWRIGWDFLAFCALSAVISNGWFLQLPSGPLIQPKKLFISK